MRTEVGSVIKQFAQFIIKVNYTCRCRNLRILVVMVSEMGGQLNNVLHSSITVCDLTEKIFLKQLSFSMSVRRVAPQHRDRIVTTDYCDVTSPYVYSHRLTEPRKPPTTSTSPLPSREVRSNVIFVIVSGCLFCLPVFPLAYLKNVMSKLHEIFCA